MKTDHGNEIGIRLKENKELMDGIGHTLTLLVFGVILILLKNEISEAWAVIRISCRNHVGISRYNDDFFLGENAST